MRQKKWTRLCLEKLEDRTTPVTFNFIGAGGTLTLNQVSAAIADLSITDDAATGAITVDDTGDQAPPLTLNTAGFSNLTVNLLTTDTVPLTYSIISPRGGNVALNINNAAPRGLTIVGGGSIGGNLTVTGGNGGLSVNEVGAPLIVGGNATFNGGLSVDALNLGVPGTLIGGNFNLSKFNVVLTSAGDVVGGTLSFNDFGEFNTNALVLMDSVVGLDLNYFGGARGDTVVLGGTSTVVGRNVSVNFSTQLPTDSSALVQPSPSSVIGGNVNVMGGNLGMQAVVLSGVVGGSISINLGNAAVNTVVVNGLLGGSSFVYIGGVGTDTVVFSPVTGSNRVSFTALLGAGNDVVVFGNPFANPSFAFIDFGAGNDAFIGVINFRFNFLNLP
jgi:hypothetical protein